MKIYLLNYHLSFIGAEIKADRKDIKKVFKTYKALKDYIKEDREELYKIEKDGANQGKTTDYNFTIRADIIDTDQLTIKRKFYYEEQKEHQPRKAFNIYKLYIRQIDSKGNKTEKESPAIELISDHLKEYGGAVFW